MPGRPTALNQLEDAVWVHPDHRDSSQALRFAQDRGLPLKFSPFIERDKLYVILPSRMEELSWRGGSMW